MAFCGGRRLNGIGFGTWSWGNQLVWGYSPERDDLQLQATFWQALASGLNLIDTALMTFGHASNWHTILFCIRVPAFPNAPRT